MRVLAVVFAVSLLFCALGQQGFNLGSLTEQDALGLLSACGNNLQQLMVSAGLLSARDVRASPKRVQTPWWRAWLVVLACSGQPSALARLNCWLGQGCGSAPNAVWDLAWPADHCKQG